MSQGRDVRSRQPISVSLSLLVAVLVLSDGGLVMAQGARGVISDLIRGTAKVADDVPLRKVDDLIADLGRSKAAREAVETEIRGAGKIGKASEAVKGLSRADEVLLLLGKATKNLDPSVLKRIEQLDEASRESALLMAKGGEQLQRSLPDLAARGRFLQEGGAETVAAIGVHGPDAARAAMRLDEAIQGGTVIAKEGTRAASLADFGRVMTRTGDASWPFWKTYIQPHWKIWAGTGALAAYLAAPEMFQDAAGGLTEAGFQRLIELAGATAAGAIRGVGQGAANAVDQTTEALTQTFWTSARSRSAMIGVAVLALAALAVPGVRSRMRSVVRWSLGASSKPNNPDDSKSAA